MAPWSLVVTLVLVAHFNCVAQLDEHGFDEEDVGPHGSAPGGPGHNVNIGDSLKELNQKMLAERKTYKPTGVADQCANIEELLVDQDRAVHGLYGLCITPIDPEGFRITWFDGLVRRKITSKTQFMWTISAEHTDLEQFVAVLKGRMKIGYDGAVRVLIGGKPIKTAHQLLHSQFSAAKPVVIVDFHPFMMHNTDYDHNVLPEVAANKLLRPSKLVDLIHSTNEAISVHTPFDHQQIEEQVHNPKDHPHPSTIPGHPHHPETRRQDL